MTDSLFPVDSFIDSHSPRSTLPGINVMIDLETTGGDPQQNHLIQVGMCVFGVRPFRIFDEYCACIDRKLVPDRCDDQQTLDWWLDTDADLFDEITSSGRDPRVVMAELSAKLEVVRGMSPGGRIHLWGQPAHFDLRFLYHFAEDYGPGILAHNTRPFQGSATWHDARSWLDSFLPTVVADSWEFQMFEPPFTGRMHDAVYDAKWQAWNMDRACAAWESHMRRQIELLTHGGQRE